MAFEGRPARSNVDWAEIDAEIQAVPAEYRDQRFYPLKQVIDIFSSGDPEGQAIQLRSQEDRLSESVDDVVEAYHNGFAKSIQNYSLILQLFQESKQQVDNLKKAVSEGTRQLGAQSKTLNQQWRRGLSLSSSLNLVNEIRSAVQIPSKVEAAANAKDWPTAVEAVLEGCNRLIVGDLAKVGALRKLQADLIRLSRWIQEQLYEELQRRAYAQVSVSIAQAGKVNGAFDTVSNELRQTLAAGLRSAAATVAVGLGGRTGASFVVKGSGGNSFMERSGDSIADVQTNQFLMNLRSDASTSGFILGKPSGPTGGHVGTSANAMGVAAGGGGRNEAAAAAAACRTLVRCLAQLEGVSEAKAYIHYHCRKQVQKLMFRSMEASADSAQAALQALGTKGPESVTARGHSSSLAMTQSVEVLAQKMVQGVCGVCLKALTNYGMVLSELADAPAGSGHLHALRHLQQLLDGGEDDEDDQAEVSSVTGSPIVKGGGVAINKQKAPSVERQEYIKAEYLYAWSQMQEEWVLLLAELLGLPVRSMGLLAEAGQQPKPPSSGTAGMLGNAVFLGMDVWMAGMADRAEQALGGYKDEQQMREKQQQAADDAAKQQHEGSRLFFSFDLTVQGLATAGKAGAATTDMQLPEQSSYNRVVFKALGNHPGSPYLTPSVYTTLNSFTEAAASLVAKTVGIQLQAKPGDPYNTADGMLAGRWRRGGSLYPSAGGAVDTVATESAAVRWLQQQLETFVQNSFLPQVWVDLRAKCTRELVDNSESFKPGNNMPAMMPVAEMQGNGSSSGVTESYRGASKRVVLPAARFTERMLIDLCGWSEAMSAFEEPFLGLAENVLSKALDTFTSVLENLSCESRSWALASRPDVSHAMALEPDAMMLGRGAVSFYVPSGLAGEVGWNPQDFYAELNTGGRPLLVHTHARWGGDSRPGGLGKGGQASQAELLRMLFKEYPIPGDQLLYGTGPAASSARLVRLAALGEAMDYVAEAIVRLIGHARGGLTEGELPEGVTLLVERYRAVSGLCARMIRLELQLQVVHLLHPLGRASHLCEGDEAKEVHPCIGNLIRVMGRLAEEILPHLSHSRASYVLSGVAPAAARVVMWSLEDVHEMNALGVERMVRTLAVLQPALSTLSPPLSSAAAYAESVSKQAEADGEEDILSDSGLSNSNQRSVDSVNGAVSSTRLFEEWAMRTERLYRHACGYYGMLMGKQATDVLEAAGKHPMRYSYQEWCTLLRTRVHRRLVTVGHLEELQQSLDQAYGLVPQNKLAEAFGTMVNAIQAPAELITDTLTDVIRVGGGALVAGAMLPAQGIRQVFKIIQDRVTEQ
ncbi:hypothetical protein CEUSTIGMA_g1985.t1 [Chlamydomonas eustigma]|uniref:Exocyst complex component Sec8 n=1 Tax=Chlamydomonas eustigma TaxID=1157962 RepID=A0A250WUV6_9CHLO|nr:hypothetical protein CEUSTIGMA_g1985.t1 [Chlamydomonas eustigma]|eukprot:GAX74536.1 hypothetical protein CEUSTIGMA_g1985.t1 [Chlamydomonas eustigma]